MNKRSQPDKGMIFDFNGTLFQDSLQQENAWRIFARQALQRTITDSELQKYIHGRSNDSILRFFIGKPLSAKEILTLSEEKEKLYRRLCIEQLSFNLAPGAEALLTNLKLRNIPRAIGTASGKKNVDFYLKRLNLNRWFESDSIVYNDGSLQGKPAPDIYLKAARSLHLFPEQCTVFEDAVSGIQEAVSAKIGRIIVIAPLEKHNFFKSMTGVSDVIENFYDFRL